MLQAKDLKNKIKSVKSINHITKAMKMVAAAKLKKSQKKMESIKPYSDKVEELVSSIVSQPVEIDSPYMRKRENSNSLLLVIISSDKGLCGSYNTNLIKEFETLYRRNNWSEKKLYIVTMGKKITDYIKKSKHDLYMSFLNNETSPTLEDVKPFFDATITPFLDKKVDEVKILHTKYINNITNNITLTELLPITISSDLAVDSENNKFVFDPGMEEIFQFLMPRYVRTKLYSLLMNTITSEHSVRMTSMEHATEKSTEMIDELSLKLNKVRQEAITLELLDIISGSEALK